MKVEKIQIEGSLKLEAVCNYLSDIASSLRDGQVCVIKDSDFVTLIPSDQMEISISAGKKKGKEKLTMKLSWDTPLGSEKCPTMFAISSQEPELPEQTEDAPQDAEASAPQDASEKQDKESVKAAPAAPAEAVSEANAPKAETDPKAAPKSTKTAAKKNVKKPAKAATKK